MVSKTCEVCGTSYEAKRKDSRVCSATCRAKKSKGKARDQVAKQNAPAAPAAGATGVGLVDQVRADLVKAGQLQTTLGQGALVLATRICSSVETGSAIAGMHKELRQTMAIALQQDASSPLKQMKDELAERREAVRAVGKASRKRRPGKQQP